jgi:NADH:ubiquinone oxidoreductase subunit 6 (subunit J)
MSDGRWEIIKWWELRRIPYTIIIGAVGVLSLFIANSIIDNYAQTGEDFLKPISLLIGIPFAMIVANICYTFGWMLELAQQSRKRGEGRSSRAILFYSGLVFSVMVMSSPIWVALFSWMRHRS